MRIGLIHAVQVAIDPINQAFAAQWPDAECMNVLDDRLSVDRAKRLICNPLRSGNREENRQVNSTRNQPMHIFVKFGVGRLRRYMTNNHVAAKLTDEVATRISRIVDPLVDQDANGHRG